MKLGTSPYMTAVCYVDEERAAIVEKAFKGVRSTATARRIAAGILRNYVADSCPTGHDNWDTPTQQIARYWAMRRCTHSALEAVGVKQNAAFDITQRLFEGADALLVEIAYQHARRDRIAG